MEKRAQAAESLVATSSGQAALDHAIKAADLYMRAASEAASKKDAARLRRKCQQLIIQAEQLKAALASPSDILLRKASRLHGNDFLPWKNPPSEDEFRLRAGQVSYVDDVHFTLSPKQKVTFDAWKRPRELFISQEEIEDNVFMDSRQGCDLVQDLTTDCSVVASLCAAMRILTGRRSVLASVIHPFDHSAGMPLLSPSGKYVLRLYFNGCFRRVVIDERLPASLTDRALFVVDRRNPRLIWPALVEKAYLKVRGGYDFPGSNSGTDLWVLTGWIPEQLFLQKEDLDINTTWKRIKSAHDAEDVVVTLGTGRVSEEEEEILGLIGEHDYAVLDLKEDGTGRSLLVKNPWCDGPVWKGFRPGQQVEDSSYDNGGSSSSSQPSEGSFWMPLEEVVQHFESMYLNWNPALFSHRQDHHITWEIPSTASSSLVHNPQFSLRCPQGGPVWILAGRHFMDAELEIARTSASSMAAVSRQLGFMSILIFDNGGHRVMVGDGKSYGGPYVDSPQTLAHLEADPKKTYTIVLDQHELPLSEYGLTISFFSQAPIQVQEAKDAMRHSQEVSGSWTRRSAGGSAACPSYFTNPQFKLSIPQTGPLSLLLSTDQPKVFVHIDVVWGSGKRVDSVKVRDLVGSSGEYRRGCAIAEIPKIDAGGYTIVCSTYDAGQMGDFVLRLASMTPVTVEPIPREAAGQLRIPLPVFTPVEGEELRRAPLSASWVTRVSVNARCIEATASTFSIRLSVVHGWAPERSTVAVSNGGEFQEPRIIVRTPEFDMEPGRIQREGMWLVMESLGTHNVTAGVEVELFSDAPVHIGPWEVL